MRNPTLPPTLACAFVALLTGCGGGSGTSGSSASASPTGATDLAITDAPSSQFSHAWITVSAVWFHTSSTAGPDDPGWLKFPLASPESFDLIRLANGNLATAFSGLTLPSGTYQQVRLFLVDPSTSLQASASADGLSYNDQVSYADSSGTTQVAPLELVNPEKGIGVTGTFTLSAGSTLSLALDFDATDDVLQFDYGNQTAFVLKPHLSYFDLASVGAIVGAVNTAELSTAATSSGASNLVIKAESLSADGTYHTISRLTSIKPDGSFVLFPLRVPAGATSTRYDVVVRGEQMQTIVIKDVPVVPGTGPATGQNPTTLQADPLSLTVDTDFTANAAESPRPEPTADTVLFYQTLPLSGEVPYAIRIRETNPFAGTFFQDIPLSAGPVEYGSYSAGADIALTTVTPVEGAGSFQVFGNDDNYVRTAVAAEVTAASAPTSGPEPFTIPPLTVASPAVSDSISGSIGQATSKKYDKGFLVVTHNGDIVTTIPLDAALSAGTYSITDLPGGSATQSFPDGIYYLTARVWNSADPAASLHRESMTAVVDLRNGSASNVNLTVE